MKKSRDNNIIQIFKLVSVALAAAARINNSGYQVTNLMKVNYVGSGIRSVGTPFQTEKPK